jgi:hypothetical protein
MQKNKQVTSGKNLFIGYSPVAAQLTSGVLIGLTTKLRGSPADQINHFILG